MKTHVLLLLLVMGTLPTAAEEWQRPQRELEIPSSEPTLGQVRELLANRLAGREADTLGPISLGGFVFSRELEIGRGRRVVAVSCLLGGGLLAYDDTGGFLGAARTWEISQLQLVDLDSDGQNEIVTLQKDHSGTGISVWKYHVFSLTTAGFEQLWAGVGTSMLAVEGPPELAEGFVRFEGHKLVHLVLHPDGSQETTMYFMQNGRLDRQ